MDSLISEGEIKRSPDLVCCPRSHSRNYLDDNLAELQLISYTISSDQACGEWIGLVRLSAQETALVRIELTTMSIDSTLLTAAFHYRICLIA